MQAKHTALSSAKARAKNSLSNRKFALMLQDSPAPLAQRTMLMRRSKPFVRLRHLTFIERTMMCNNSLFVNQHTKRCKLNDSTHTIITNRTKSNSSANLPLLTATNYTLATSCNNAHLFINHYKRIFIYILCVIISSPSNWIISPSSSSFLGPLNPLATTHHNYHHHHPQHLQHNQLHHYDNGIHLFAPNDIHTTLAPSLPTTTTTNFITTTAAALIKQQQQQQQQASNSALFNNSSPPSLQSNGQQQLMSCANGLLTFELSTGFIYKPTSAETLAMMPSTLQLTDCLDFCLHNSSCLAINFEMGLCVLLSSSAKQNPANLYSSQFPVFTIYAEKKCLLSGKC